MDQHLGKALNNDRLILPLTSGVLRGQAQPAAGIQSMPELLDEPLAVSLRDRRRTGKIERELRLSRGLIHMLATRTARADKTDLQLGDWNRDLVVDGYAVHAECSTC